MATAIVVMEICQEKSIDYERTYIKVPKRAENCIGTSANLKENQKLTILECLYGLMLPSGNDAAITLASYFGNILFQEYRYKRRHHVEGINLYVDFFVLEMNRMAKRNLLKDTIFSNPHGLSDKGNKSTVKDLCMLTYIYMKNPVLKEISKTQHYEATVSQDIHINGNEEEEAISTLYWKSTNKLLDNESVIGGKTGVTPNAGCCLALLCEEKPKQFIIVLLGASNSEKRWSDSIKLINFAKNNCFERKSSYLFRVTK